MFKKLKKGLLAGTIFSTAANMNACVYGPPPNSDLPADQSSVIQTTPAEDDSFRPEDNQNVDVYGPPEWFDNSSENADDSSDEEEAPDPDEGGEEFKPEDNMNVCVYGPPEMLQ